MKRADFMWCLMLKDGTIIEGEGYEKALKSALQTPDIVDGDVWCNGVWKNISFWMFLIK